MIRIVWPNGVLQSEFDRPAKTTIAASQRLKGSCPWLFAWNGREMAFVTDLIWRSPLGLRINAQDTADVLTTEDWVKVRGDQLVARDGAYDLRITAELWETHFFDLVSLMTVDHPAGTEVFVDERFADPDADARADRHRPGAAAGARRATIAGSDVSGLVARADDRHVDFAGRGAYQGVTRPHAIELTLPETAPRSGPLWLIAHGWVHPTDSSINVAMGQGRHAPPQGLALEAATRRRPVPYRPGRPRVPVRQGQDGADRSRRRVPGQRHRPAPAAPDAPTSRSSGIASAGRSDVPTCASSRAACRRWPRICGFAATRRRASRPRARPSGRATCSPARRRAGAISRATTRASATCASCWPAVDDRYVIMNAGDEIALRFGAAPPAGGRAWCATSSWSATAG